MNKIYAFLICLSILSACTSKSTDNNKDIEFVSFSGHESLYQEDIDQVIKQELYDQLYRIYMIRKLAIDNLIDDYILDIESQKQNLSKDEYLNAYIEQHLTDSLIQKKRNVIGLDQLPAYKRNYKQYALHSTEGKQLLREALEKQLLKSLLDSLKLIYRPQIHLEAPIPPQIDLNQIQTFYKGNLDSQIILLEVSDMECSKCRAYYTAYKAIYEKYKTKVKFGFVHFSSYPSLSAIAANAAAKQGQFWTMYDSIMSKPVFLDSSAYFNLAKTIGLNMKQFRQDFYDSETASEIAYHSRLIKAYGLYATPSILINGKLIFDSSSKEEIELRLEQALMQ